MVSKYEEKDNAENRSTASSSVQEVVLQAELDCMKKKLDCSEKKEQYQKTHSTV